MEVSDNREKEKHGEEDESDCREEDGGESQENSVRVGVGVSSLMSTLLSDHDSTAKLTLASQNHLSSSLHRLTQELDQLLDDAPLPFVVQHGSKIVSVRKRVWSLNGLLKSVQQRLDRMDQMLTLSHAHEQKKCAEKKATTESGENEHSRDLT